MFLFAGSHSIALCTEAPYKLAVPSQTLPRLELCPATSGLEDLYLVTHSRTHTVEGKETRDHHLSLLQGRVPRFRMVKKALKVEANIIARRKSH